MTCGAAGAFRSSALLIAIALALAGCRPHAREPQGVGAGGDCANVERLRVCWNAGVPHVVGHATAPGPARAPAFTCSGAHCEQRHPRMPDTGEWQCSDSAGATVCRGGERAAGVAPAPADPAWLCGARRGGPPGERLCVDLSPDFPDGRASGWRCRTLYEGPVRRVCDRDAGAHTLGDACERAHPCVDGSRCVDGVCVPERPAPACWLETDCGGGRCRFGSCLEAGT